MKILISFNFFFCWFHSCLIKCENLIPSKSTDTLTTSHCSPSQKLIIHTWVNNNVGGQVNKVLFYRNIIKCFKQKKKQNSYKHLYSTIQTYVYNNIHNTYICIHIYILMYKKHVLTFSFPVNKVLYTYVCRLTCK